MGFVTRPFLFSNYCVLTSTYETEENISCAAAGYDGSIDDFNQAVQ